MRKVKINRNPRQRFSERFKSGGSTLRNIMAGILLLPGRVATRIAVRQSSRSLFSVNKTRFECAAADLQTLNLGALVYLEGRSTTAVFVKKLPSEVGPILAEEHCSDLCNLYEYTQRFYTKSPKSITNNPNLVDAIIQSGRVAPEVLER